MIQAEHLTRHSAPRPLIRGVAGRKEFDFQRFAETLNMLEAYVDGVLSAGAVDRQPWVEEQVKGARVASL